MRVPPTGRAEGGLVEGGFAEVRTTHYSGSLWEGVQGRETRWQRREAHRGGEEEEETESSKIKQEERKTTQRRIRQTVRGEQSNGEKTRAE